MFYLKTKPKKTKKKRTIVGFKNYLLITYGNTMGKKQYNSENAECI